MILCSCARVCVWWKHKPVFLRRVKKVFYTVTRRQPSRDREEQKKKRSFVSFKHNAWQKHQLYMRLKLAKKVRKLPDEDDYSIFAYSLSIRIHSIPFPHSVCPFCSFIFLFASVLVEFLASPIRLYVQFNGEIPHSAHTPTHRHTDTHGKSGTIVSSKYVDAIMPPPNTSHALNINDQIY